MQFDIIIVGAGSAGCILADRLSADGRSSVLLIEAGPEDRGFYLRIPMGLPRVVSNPRNMWYYPVEADPAIGDKERLWLRGRVLGGSSAVNGMVYCRGNPDDYDGWERAGATGWGWDAMRAAFMAIEDHALGPGGARGVGGPLPVSIHPYRSALTAALLAGAEQLGVPVKADINDPEPDQQGIGYTPATIRQGRRVSAADAFLAPARRRPNLHIVTDTRIDRILFDGRRAIGVDGAGPGGPVRYHAARRVILSAGTLASPKLLQLSGIGPADHLRALGIPVLVDRPAVGQNLREHHCGWLNYRLNRPIGHNRDFHGWRLGWNALRYQLFRQGPLGWSPGEINGFVRTRDGLKQPDAQISFWSLTMERSGIQGRVERSPGFQAAIWPTRPESRGSVLIRSADPADYPHIHPAFLSDERDRRILVDGFRFLRRIAALPDVAAFIDHETFPGQDVQSDDAIIAAAVAEENSYHGTGTCRMGSDLDAVVDPVLRVRGVEGLSIADCSVMPTQVSAGTAAAAMALGWNAAVIMGQE